MAKTKKQKAGSTRAKNQTDIHHRPVDSESGERSDNGSIGRPVQLDEEEGARRQSQDGRREDLSRDED